MAARPSGRARKAQITQSNGDAAGVSERGADRAPRQSGTDLLSGNRQCVSLIFCG